ncbi:type I-F CRISPR-associated protein Csy1 [Pseudomonas sp. MPFS]|uniref:type I-F CRISPR-associated protein Csy1 n=1 Tax=Pseudomonas sp. MPFS TaxID=2795724 RepID=UPI001F14380C|nr:type I-F CRISPR-associated protein Csy1 [Pseudomonas sp. MPFS]UMZ12947.1 type I-F CRISPR-associated protein Csy1 [Pseudomonas sp. MPFS]
MNEGSNQAARSTLFRNTITTFINERRDAKLKGDEAGDATKYEYSTWLADAARRVAQIQAVTHVLKATHPDARGSSLHAAPQTLTQHQEIGTHVLASDYVEDIVGNAAALDVYKFLKLEVEGRRLLDWLQQDDVDLLAALSPDPTLAQSWAGAFKGLIRSNETLVSHSLAKQVFWCVSGEPSDDAGFELLQPMFPSSLVHAVHADINERRFGEANKAARQARRNRQPYTGTYGDYPQLVVRKLGGTKPQNISQLNSERGGVNYLLASLPPLWKQQHPGSALHLDSAFTRLRRFEDVDELVEALCILLQADSPPTMHTRLRRERIERALGRALAAFGLSFRASLPAGWSRDNQCRLALCEQLWLDPQRAQLPPREEYMEADQAFTAAFARQAWAEEVAHRFGNWLNGILLQRGLPVGDTEQAHWARQAVIEAETSQSWVVDETAVEVMHG